MPVRAVIARDVVEEESTRRPRATLDAADVAGRDFVEAAGNEPLRRVPVSRYVPDLQGAGQLPCARAARGEGV